jgi:hypothetical protein
MKLPSSLGRILHRSLRSRKVRFPFLKMGTISELMISITCTLFSPLGNRMEEINDASAPRSFVKTNLMNSNQKNASGAPNPCKSPDSDCELYC